MEGSADSARDSDSRGIGDAGAASGKETELALSMVVCGAVGALDGLRAGEAVGATGRALGVVGAFRALAAILACIHDRLGGQRDSWMLGCLGAALRQLRHSDGRGAASWEARLDAPNPAHRHSPGGQRWQPLPNTRFRALTTTTGALQQQGQRQHQEEGLGHLWKGRRSASTKGLMDRAMSPGGNERRRTPSPSKGAPPRCAPDAPGPASQRGIADTAALLFLRDLPDSSPMPSFKQPTSQRAQSIALLTSRRLRVAVPLHCRVSPPSAVELPADAGPWVSVW